MQEKRHYKRRDDSVKLDPATEPVALADAIALSANPKDTPIKATAPESGPVSATAPQEGPVSAIASAQTPEDAPTAKTAAQHDVEADVTAVEQSKAVVPDQGAQDMETDQVVADQQLSTDVISQPANPIDTPNKSSAPAVGAEDAHTDGTGVEAAAISVATATQDDQNSDEVEAEEGSQPEGGEVVLPEAEAAADDMDTDQAEGAVQQTTDAPAEEEPSSGDGVKELPRRDAGKKGREEKAKESAAEDPSERVVKLIATNKAASFAEYFK